MSSVESPTSESPKGPLVGDDEELYRCITHPAWWVEEEQRISSAAFSYPVFSVDVASIAGSPEATLARFRPGTGLAVFRCRFAKELGCVVQHEIDPQLPNNKAHAHVYTPHGAERKRNAKKLAEECSKNVLRVPSFPAE